MKERTTDHVSLTGHCTGCNAKVTLTSKQILDAEKYQEHPLSDCCFMPIIVDKATFSKSTKKNNR